MNRFTKNLFRKKNKGMVKGLLPLLFLFMMGAQLSWGQATLPFYDGLNYTTGTQLVGQGGWILNSAAAATGDIPIVSGSLSYSGLAASTGGKTSIAAGGDDVIKSFTTNTSKIYYSFLMNITSLTSFTGGTFVGLIPSTAVTASTTAVGSGSVGATSWVKPSATTGYFNMGFSARSNQTTTTNLATTLTYGTTDYPLNTVVLVVASYEIVSGSANDVCKLWINPTPGTTEPTATFTATPTSDLADLAGLFIKQNATASTPGVDLDEFRIGTTWADVTPSSGALTAPTLVADATANTVDNAIDISFTADAAWNAAVTAVKIGTTTLTLGTDYELTAGNLQLKPSGGNAALTASGSKSVTVLATGYINATLTQGILAGAPTAANSAVSISPSLAKGTTSTVTCTAKDQYNNLVSGYAFKYNVTRTDANAGVQESYTFDSVAYTANASGVATAVTNASGVTTFAVVVPATVNVNDGVSFQVTLANGSTTVGSAYSFTNVLTPQTITFDALSPVNYAAAGTTTLTGTASSGLTVSYTSSNTAVATVSGATVTIVGVGTTTITASQAGDATYDAAPSVSRDLVINCGSTSNNTTTISACGSYTWANTGVTYTTSGIKTGTTTNCVTEVLDLTISGSTNTTTVTVCEPYTWANTGVTYSVSGIYDGTTTDCVLEKLNLTINATTSYYADADGDGVGAGTAVQLCATSAPTGYATTSTDCDDANSSVWRTGTFYRDIDADGYLDKGESVCYGSSTPAGYFASASTPNKVWDFSNKTTSTGIGATDVVNDQLGLYPTLLTPGTVNMGAITASVVTFAATATTDTFGPTVTRLQLNGGGSTTTSLPSQRYAYFDVDGACRVLVWFRTGGSGTRTLFVTDGSNVINSLGSANSSENLILKANYTGGAKRLYIYGDQSCNIYKIQVTGANVTTPSIVAAPNLSFVVATANTVDNNIDVTFTDDATWRAAVTAVKIGAVTLTPGTDYELTAGHLILKPSGGNVAITAAGSKKVNVFATGYSSSSTGVTQTIIAGAVSAITSTATISTASTPDSSRTITLTAKDQYGNNIAGNAFKYAATITNNGAGTAESYTIDGAAKTETTSDIAVTSVTNASGVATFTVAFPNLIDSGDGISIQAKLNDGTNLGSAFAFVKPSAVVTDATICSGTSYTWSANSVGYTSSQTVTINNNGFTADQVLNLTVTPKPTTVVTNASICSGSTYTWSANGLGYTTSQTALTITNDGCTADQVLNLTVTTAPNAGTDGTLSIHATPTDADLLAALGVADTNGTWSHPEGGFVGVHTYTVQPNSPCSVADTATVTVSFESEIPASPYAVCTGATVATASTGTTLKFYKDDKSSTTAYAGTQKLAAATYYITETVNGLETARVPVVVTLTALIAPTAVATSEAKVICKYIGTSNPVTFTATASGAASYVWTLPEGATISGSATGASIQVNFLNVSATPGAIGSVSVDAKNALGCPSGKPKVLALTTKAASAPKSVVLTYNAVAVKKAGNFVGDASKTLTLTATDPSGTADHYTWTLPEGTTVVSGDANNDLVIAVHLGEVAAANTPLVFSCTSVAGCGSSAKSLSVARAEAGAPKAIALTDALSATPTVAIKKLDSYTGTLKERTLTLTATPNLTAGSEATSYQWVLPAAATVVGGTATLVDTNTYTSISASISINLANVGTETSLVFKVYGVNGNGRSVASKDVTCTSAAPKAPTAIYAGSAGSGTLFTTYNPSCNTVTISVPAVTGVSYSFAPVSGGATFGTVTDNSVSLDLSGTSNVAKSTVMISATAFTATGSSTKTFTIKLGTACSGPKLAPEDVIADDELSVIAYPNPSATEFTIESSRKGVNVQVYDLMGRLIENRQATSNSVQVGRNYASGVYNVIVNQGTKVKTLKVIKK